ncbi:MAG TPA: DMT family transporter [Chloroflexia bacterium]|nr:DMT family transporter [Chloroflexia bacterium]
MSTDTQTQPAAAAQSQAGSASAAQQGFTIYDVALLGMVITWAANPAALKWALQYMDPLAFNALRFVLATLLPVGLVLFGRERFGWHRGDGWKILLLGVFGHGVYQAVFIVGLSQTLAGNVALILSVNPAFVAVFSALFGFERIRPYQWVGIAMTLAGVGLVVLGTGNPLEFGSRLLGDVLIVGITMMWALYTVVSGPLLKRYSAVKLNALTMPVGAVVLLLVAGPSLAAAAPTFPEVPAPAWLVLALSGILAVSLSYIIWYRGLQVLGATRTAVYANLVPVLAALISFFIAQEPLGWTFWTGMAIVLAGVSLTRFGGRLVRG